MDHTGQPPIVGSWPPPPFEADLDLIGDMERGQAAASRPADPGGSAEPHRRPVPPFEPDLDLIGDMEQPQRSALQGDPSLRRRRRFWRGGW